MQKEVNTGLGQDQFYDLITGKDVSWQSIIYDLIKSEQLNPWDINLGVLAEKYVTVIEQMEEADFFVSSKVLLACSLLLRLKSEILSTKYLEELDEAIYGKKEEKHYELERIELDEDELPVLTPRTPLPRYRKVTLKELMSSLNQAIETENRRIRKDIKKKRAEKSALVVLPNKNRVPLKKRIPQIFGKVQGYLKQPHITESHMPYSHLAKTHKERIETFLPILHLSNHGKIYLRQPEHFGEIYLHISKIKEDDEMLELIEDAMGLEV